jgi:hypothetical protein
MIPTQIYFSNPPIPDCQNNFKFISVTASRNQDIQLVYLHDILSEGKLVLK